MVPVPGRHCPTVTNSLFQNNMEAEAAIEMALHPGLDETLRFGFLSLTRIKQTKLIKVWLV